jgi:DNA topoisomerase-6 subunit A
MSQERFFNKKLKAINDQEISAAIKKVCSQIITDLENAKRPSIQSIKESADNAVYDIKKGILVAGDKKNTVELNVGSIKKMTRMLLVAEVLLQNVKMGVVNSKREIYYRVKNTLKGKPTYSEVNFHSQEECDDVIDELAAMLNKMREDFNVFANERSGLTYSNALIVTETLPDGSTAVIDLSAMGTSAFVPKNKPQDLALSIKKGKKVDYCLVIESEGTLSTFFTNGYFLKHQNAILISTGGVPSMGCRAFIKKIQDQLSIPIYGYFDLDAYSIASLMRSTKSGAFNSLIRSEEYSAPEIKLLGVIPSDIKKYHLDFYKVNEKDPGEARALKRAEDALKNDPFFKDKKNKKYSEILQWLLDEQIRCEQQSYFGGSIGKNDTKDPYIAEKIIIDKIKNKDFI